LNQPGSPAERMCAMLTVLWIVLLGFWIYTVGLIVHRLTIIAREVTFIRKLLARNAVVK